MGSMSPERVSGERARPTALKILVAGGVGVGKTALVGSMSEITPLRAEGTPVNAAFCLEDAAGVDPKSLPLNTVDFGRITIDEALILYLFDTPEQNRYLVLRDELSDGALGAVVLADPARLDECVPAIEYFKRRGTPYMVAVSGSGSAQQLEAIRRAVPVEPHIPVTYCDPRLKESGRNVLITLIEYVRAVSIHRAAPLSA
jgi:signal recognition particle receptor subunit beta